MEILIQIPIYKTALLIYFGDRDGLLKAVKKHGGKAQRKEIEAMLPDESEVTDGSTYLTKDRSVTIHLPSTPTTPRDVAVLNHELSHATNYILMSVGMQHTEETEEAYTYLLEYITLKATERLFTSSCLSP